MPRVATSLLEIEQIQRVSALLSNVAPFSGQTIVVTTADGKARAGKLLSHNCGSRRRRRGKETCHYGTINLATPTGEAEINYLDFVLIALK